MRIWKASHWTADLLKKQKLLVAKIDKIQENINQSIKRQTKHKDDTLICQFAKENPFSNQLKLQNPVSF